MTACDTALRLEHVQGLLVKVALNFHITLPAAHRLVAPDAGRQSLHRIPLEEAGFRAGHLPDRSRAHPFARLTVGLNKSPKGFRLGEIARAAKAAEGHGRHGGAN